MKKKSKKETWPGLILEVVALLALLVFAWLQGWNLGTVAAGYVVALLLVIAFVGEAASVANRVRFVELEGYGERAVQRKAEFVINNFAKHHAADEDEIPSDEDGTFKRYGS